MKLFVKVFVDPLCPECQRIWSSVTTAVGKFNRTVQLKVYLLPLPYHTRSNAVSRLLYAIRLCEVNVSKFIAFDLLNNLYEDNRQNNFSEDQKDTIDSVKERIIGYGDNVTYI